MHVVIIGGAGLLGRKLGEALLRRGHLAGLSGEQANLSKLVLFDRATPHPPLASDPRLEIVTGDVTDQQQIQALITSETDVIFHLAAILSGQSEQNLELALRVNLRAGLALLERCRVLETQPRFVFSSTVAVFGGDMPPVIQDDFATTPQSTYGSLKAASELLINDYSRRGFIDGRAVRLPTIVVRPGQPNQATSTFASSIIREPLQGRPAICPVSPETRLWILSPKRAIESLIHAAEISADAWGSSRIVTLPGLSVSVGEIVETLAEMAGPAVVERIAWQPDPFIQTIVGSWPADFAPKRAKRLGFKADKSVRHVIQSFIDDELGGRFIS